MRREGGSPREEQLRDLANAQWGLLHQDDLLGAGLTASHIQRRVEACRLTVVFARVYAFGHTVLRDEGRWLAALWTCGETAVLSHATAALFHGFPLDRGDDPDLHVTTTVHRRSRPGLRVHRVRGLDPIDVFRARLLTATTIPRTFVDLADVLAWPEYRALADAQRRLDLAAIRAAQERAPGRRGHALVTRLIEADDAHTKSEFERRFLRFLSAHGLPRPDGTNVWVAGHKADCLYSSRRLIVELDGRAYHARRGQMRADRARDTDYQLAGHRIMRLVWDDLHVDSARRTADRLRRMLAAGG